MEEDSLLKKFTKEDLEKFQQLEEKIVSLSSPLARVSYINSIFYGFKNYIVDRLVEEFKTAMSKGKKPGLDINKVVLKMEESEEYLTLEEMRFLVKLKNLAEYQKAELHFYFTYHGIRLPNQSGYLLEEHKPEQHANLNERLVWLSEKEKLEMLINELIKYNFVGRTETDNLIAIFCDINFKVYNTLRPEHIKWLNHKTQLTFLIGLLISPKYKMISDKEIWVRVCHNFIDKNSQPMNPKQLSVSSQNAKPKNSGLITSIVELVKNYTIPED